MISLNKQKGADLTRNCEEIEKVAFELIKQAAIYLPQDVKTALQKAYREENSRTGKTQLKAILDNVALAEKLQAPICQDTGTITFYIKAGTRFKRLAKVEAALVSAVRRATAEIPLRPNAVNPFTGKNSGDNVGRLIPILHWEIVEGDALEISVLLKGGGSENACALRMLNPGDGVTGLKRLVVDAVVEAGAQPCPPTILGVAVGGGADYAMFLAKKALLRRLGEANADAKAAALERELMEAANLTGLGPMGLGGRTSVLGVHVDFAYRHPASFPVAVAFSCWACRRSTAKISCDGRVMYLEPKGAGDSS